MTIDPASTAMPPVDDAGELLAFGEAMIEFNRTGADDGRSWLQGFGGDTSNFLVAAARQGARCGYLSALGQDPFAQSLRALWEAEGICHRDVRTDPVAPTGLYFVTHGPQGHEFHFRRAGSAASRYRPDDLPRERIAAAAWLHVSGISLAISDSACDAGLQALRLARAAGVRTSVDTNLRLKLWQVGRARVAIDAALALADVALPSFDDLATLLDTRDPLAMLAHCRQLGAAEVVLKRGSEGTLLWARDSSRSERAGWGATPEPADQSAPVAIPPYPCKPVDATGAGDTFGGAYAARRLAGDAPLAAAHYAAAAAALSTEGFGAVAPIPRAEAVLARLATLPTTTNESPR